MLPPVFLDVKGIVALSSRPCKLCLASAVVVLTGCSYIMAVVSAWPLSVLKLLYLLRLLDVSIGDIEAGLKLPLTMLLPRL